MTKLIIRYFAVLGVIIGVAWVYSLLAVPMIEGSVARSTDVSFNPDLDTVRHRDRRFDLESLLPSDAWEFGSCIRLETEQGQLFFKEYQSLDDGRLEVAPLTIILDQQSDDDSASHPLVLRSPKGAVLRFSEEFTFGQSNPGKLEYTWLKDEVVIFQPASEKGDDQLEIVTQNVSIDQQRITTPHEVTFQMGPHHGRGKDLSLSLVPPNDPRKKSGSIAPVGDLGVLELVTLEEMVLYPTDSMLEKMKSQQDQDNPSASLTISDQSRPQLGSASNEKKEPVTIHCQGPFRFDFQTFTASFERQVEVAHKTDPFLDPDRLTCDKLTAVFGSKLIEPTNPFGPQASDSSLEQMNHLELKALEAIGQPAIFDLPSQSGYAEAGFMRFEPATNRIVLQDKFRVHLRHENQIFDAKELEYFFEDDGRIGRAKAIGPGKFTRLAEENRAEISASWKQELRIRPDDNLKAISLYGKPSVTVGSDSTFQAHELHLWIDEIEEFSAADGEKKDWKIVPTKMLALPFPEQPLDRRQKLSFDNPNYLSQQVLIRSPRLNVGTRRLEVFFSAGLVNNGNEADRSSASQGTANGAASGNPLADIGQTRPSSPDDEAKVVNQQMQCVSDLTRVRLVPKGREYRVEELTLGGDVLVEETVTKSPDEVPIKMSGQVVQATSLGSDYFLMTIQGTQEEDASVSARGLTLIGRQINLDQLANQAWIDGMGIARIVRQYDEIEQLALTNPALAEAKRQATKPTEVRWRDRMVFDGKAVHVTGDVKASGTHWLKSGERMDWRSNSGLLTLTLDRRVDLAEPKQDDASDEQAEVAEVLLDQQVVISTETFDEDGFLSARDQMRVPNLSVNQITGELKSVGAGSATSTRRNKGELVGGQQNGQTQNQVVESGKEKLIFLDIKFAAGIVGNIFRKEVHFVRQVDALVGPVQNWDAVLTRETDFTGATDERSQMLCDRLVVLEWGEDLHGKPQLEVQGIGNAFMTGQGFEATGSKVAYNQAQNMLILEGDQHAYAKLVQKVNGSGAGNWVEAKKIMYWRDTGAIDLDGVAGGHGAFSGSLTKPRR